MTAIANIVLNDAEATPVVHTFKPARQGLQPDGKSMAMFEDRVVNDGSPVGFYKISSTLSPASKGRPTYRLDLKLETPIMEVLSNASLSGYDPQPAIAHTPMFQATFVLPERSTLQQRKNLRKMVYELLNNALIVSSVEDLDFPY